MTFHEVMSVTVCIGILGKNLKGGVQQACHSLNGEGWAASILLTQNSILSILRKGPGGEPAYQGHPPH
jgi:hypothetical protein